MAHQESDEQITLYSPEYNSGNEDITLDNITHELLQTNNWKEQQKLFRIFDNKYLNVGEKSAKATTSFIIKLSLLNARPVHKRIIGFKYFFMGLALFFFAWATYYLIQIRAPYFTSLYMYAAVALLVSAGAILLVYMVKRTKNILVFYSEHGRIPIVEMLFRNPDKTSFQQFTNELINCIQSSKTENYYTDSQLLAAELSEHRRLRDEGILSSKQYEKAKARIFSSHSDNSS